MTIDERNSKIANDIEVACGKCSSLMKLDEKDARIARAFDCNKCSYKTRVYVRYKK